MSKSILLCDDDAYILRAAEIKLRKAGYDVRIAPDGRTGWQMIEERKPDLLVTDYQMPHVTGRELIERIRGDERFADLPIMLLTAKGCELAEEELQQRWGVLRIIAKPFSPREVLGFVDEALGVGAGR